MAFYHDKVERVSLVDKIVQLLTTAPVGSAEPYWKKVNSGTYENEGYILKSSGKTGGQDIFVQFRTTTATNMVQVSTLENYVPNPTMGIAGTITGASSPALAYYHTLAYDAAFPVEYYLSFDRDKIILVLDGDKSINGVMHTALVWVGMTTRLDPDNDKCVVISKRWT